MAKLEDKTLTPAEQTRLREFVEEVITVCNNDFDGVTHGLDELAEVAAEILGMNLKEPKNEDWEDVDVET